MVPLLSHLLSIRLLYLFILSHIFSPFFLYPTPFLCGNFANYSEHLHFYAFNLTALFFHFMVYL